MTLRQTSSLTLTVEQTAAGVSRTSSQTIVQFFGNEQIGCASQIYQDSNGFLTNGSQLISSSTVSQAAYTSWTPCVGVGTAASGQQQQASADTWGRNVNFGGQHVYSNEAYCNNSGQMAYNNADVYGNSLGMSHVPPHIILAPGAVAGSDFQGEYFNNGGQCTNNGEYSSQSNQNTNNYSDVYGGCLVTNCVNKNNNRIQSLARPTVGEVGTTNTNATFVSGNALQHATNVGLKLINCDPLATFICEDFNADTAENSVGSTDSNGEDGHIIEEPIEATDLTTEPMAFLQGLNSGNLMQFSQQSVLREMMLQDFQNQSNSLPKLESHNIGGYNFSMVLKEPPKSHWVYSHITNKLYIRMDKTFNIDVQFKALMPIQPLNLRVFLCFNKDVSGPVLRCQNHLSTEPVTNQNQKMRESLVRCENPSTTYCGSAQGKGISERYSVLVPLNLSRSSSRNGGYVRQTLAFKFVCQNSCLGRKETSLLFCLENSSGDILAQYVMAVKICTCPKRDCTQDERHANVRKRKSLAPSDVEEDADVKPAKARRRTVSYKRDVKDETESNDSHDTEQQLPIDWQVSRTPDGEYRLAITCPKKEWLLQNIEGMIKESAAQVLRSPTKPHLRSYAHNLLELKKRAFDLP